MKTLILTIVTAALLSITSFGNAAEAGGLRKHRFHSNHVFAAQRHAELVRIRKAKRAAARRARLAQIRRAKIAAAKKAKIAKKRRIAALNRRAAARRVQAQEILAAEQTTDATVVAVDDVTKDEIVVADIDTDRVLDCKKYIPSAGMTISVPCND